MRSRLLLLYSVLCSYIILFIYSISFIISNIYHYILRIIRLLLLSTSRMKGFSFRKIHMRITLFSYSLGRPTCFLSRNSNRRWFRGLAPPLYLVSPSSPSRITHISHRYIVIFRLALTASSRVDTSSLCLLHGFQPFVFNRL